MRDALTSHRIALDTPRALRHDARHGSEDPERSGIRTRQSCGFFAPCFNGRDGADTRPGNGEEARRLRSVFTLPPASRSRMKTAHRWFSKLTQESHMTTTHIPVPVTICLANTLDFRTTPGLRTTTRRRAPSTTCAISSAWPRLPQQLATGARRGNRSSKSGCRWKSWLEMSNE